MNAIMRSFVMGMLPGAVSRAQFPQAQKEPVAYLYDNVPLVDIDSVYTDELKTKYPYAVITHATFGVYALSIRAEPWRGTDEDYVFMDKVYGKKLVNTSLGVDFSASIRGGGTPEYEEWYQLDYLTTEIGQAVDYDGDGYKDGVDCAIWSNHDILSADGKTVLIAKSDPIPVYE